VVELRIGGNVHRQTRPGKVAGVIETHVMLNHRRVGPFGQLKMVAIVGGVDFVALQPWVICISSSGLAGRWLRFTWICVTLRARLGQVQENLRLNRGAQALAIVVITISNRSPGVIAQFRVINAVDKHQAHRIHGQRQRVSSLRTDRRRTRHKLAVQQAIKRGVFPVFMFTRRQAEAQHLLQVLLRQLRAIPLRLKQPVPLLECITAVR
jgi:hypothetical protein